MTLLSIVFVVVTLLVCQSSAQAPKAIYADIDALTAKTTPLQTLAGAGFTGLTCGNFTQGNTDLPGGAACPIAGGCPTAADW
jgi:hypothetical protein